MALKSLLPFGNRSLSVRNADYDPFQEFRRDMSRVFEEFSRSLGMSLPPLMPGNNAPAFLTPRTDVSENDNEIRIAAELPGIDKKDLEVGLDDDVLTIRASKKTERDENEGDFHVLERAEGTFYRSFVLPFTADPKQVDATFNNGVLTIAIGKPKEARKKERRIEVKHETASDRPKVDRAAAGDKPTLSEPASADA